MIFVCPHCNDELVVLENEINCKVFRHAIYKNWKQVNPHASKTVCDQLVTENKVYGCCRPFELIKSTDGKWEIKSCEYK
jgi:hypothetical protein